MEKKKFKKAVKDSILLAKTQKYSIETNELQRQSKSSRCLNTIIMQLILLSFFFCLQIVYLVEKQFSVEFTALTITCVCILSIVKAFQINAIVYIKQQLLNTTTTIELILNIVLIVFSILQMVHYTDWETQILPIALILGMYIFSVVFENYLLRKYILDYFVQRQNFGMKKALMSQASFEENLKKSIATNRSFDADHGISCQQIVPEGEEKRQEKPGGKAYEDI